jgi:hypothetical protein
MWDRYGSAGSDSLADICGDVDNEGEIASTDFQ